MTNSRRPFLLLPLLLVCCVAPCLRPTEAADPLPDGAVAVVAGKTLTFKGLCYAAYQHALPNLRSAGSIERRILLQVIDERIVAMEAEALKVAVTNDDLKQRYREWDKALRDKSNGMRTLADLMREKRTSVREFWQQMRHQLTLERVANHKIYLNGKLSKSPAKRLGEIALVLEQLRKQSEVAFGVTIASPVPKHWRREVKLENGNWLATVKNHVKSPLAPRPLTKIDYGEQLVLRLSSGAVREILDQECKTALMASNDLSLTDEEWDEEIGVQKKLWLLQRELASQEAWRSLSYDEYVKVKYKISLEDMRKNRYWRGFFGLLRRFRNSDEVRERVPARYEEQRENVWGPYILIWDITIGFAQEKGFGDRSGRTRRQAVQIAREVPKQLAKGIPFTQVVSKINAQKDPTFKAERRRIRKSQEEHLLWERAITMEDGQLSGIIETLSDLHLIRREKKYPAPEREKVLPLVLEGIARHEARTWLGNKLLDNEVVRIRWPLEERTGKQD